MELERCIERITKGKKKQYDSRIEKVYCENTEELLETQELKRCITMIIKRALRY